MVISHVRMVISHFMGQYFMGHDSHMTYPHPSIFVFASPPQKKKGQAGNFWRRSWSVFFLPNVPNMSFPHSREGNSSNLVVGVFFSPHLFALRSLSKVTQSQRGDRKEPQRPFFTVLSLFGQIDF